MSIYGFDESLNKAEVPSMDAFEAVEEMTADSGWQTATLASPFTADASNPVRYRKMGKTVYITGAVSNSEAIAAGGTATTIFTLPEGYRPEHGQYLIGKGIGRYTYYLRIYASGRVTISNYGAGASDENIPRNTWVSVTASFPVG